MKMMISPVETIKFTAVLIVIVGFPTLDCRIDHPHYYYYYYRHTVLDIASPCKLRVQHTGKVAHKHE